ncbi:MAG: FHA domain-containing protein [Chloracidobacterium sp.]|nr:FHA domain-containing protein [Chloracidobacterium sp.]MCO5334768.1 DUF5715 family protein [Pyrinomonadaceae bacterium]
MRDVTLYISSIDGERTYSLDDEVTIGRTDASTLILADGGLSRRNTTIFRDGEDILVVDEDSLNGTFLNGERLTGRARPLRDGDELKIGSDTHIRVAFTSAAAVHTAKHESAAEHSRPVQNAAAASAAKAPPTRSDDNSRYVILGSVVMIFVILAGAGIAFIAVSRKDGAGGGKQTPQIRSGLIPMRVIDPLGGEDEDDLDDLIASWEVEEKEIDASTVGDVSVGSSDAAESDLNVTAAFLADRQKKALEPRNAETGIRPAGLDPPKELFGDGVIKQKAKLREMNSTGYRQPMDFADLAAKRLDKELIEMPMATESFYLDVGGSASDGPFNSFTFQDGSQPLASGSPKFQALVNLAANFAGHQYDLNNASDRKQMRVRLLRMFNPRAKAILKEVADAYFAKYGRPLRVTSLTRSMDYQIALNANNPNSFKVRGEGSLPPHTSGCAFDLARKHMTADEQNFVMKRLAEMEDANKLDALIEYGANACFHVFIYSDGVPPKM